MAKTKKYYVVWKGNKTGVFDNWASCQEQIKGFPGALYKSFTSLSDAKKAWEENPYTHIGQGGGSSKNTKNISSSPANTSKPIKNSIAVDAACSGNPGILEYRGVRTDTGEELFHQGPFPHGTQNIGEFLAIVHGLAYLKKHDSKLMIYSDSKVAMGWVQKKIMKTTLQKNNKNAHLFELIDRALNWLENNTYENPIVKWETKIWGEIPADFGRK